MPSQKSEQPQSPAARGTARLVDHLELVDRLLGEPRRPSPETRLEAKLSRQLTERLAAELVEPDETSQFRRAKAS